MAEKSFLILSYIIRLFRAKILYLDVINEMDGCEVSGILIPDTLPAFLIKQMQFFGWGNKWYYGTFFEMMYIRKTNR